MAVPVVTAKSLKLNSFKTRLDKFLYNQDIVYDFEAPLRITNNRTGIRDLILIDNENEELITEEYTILRSEPRYPKAKVRYYRSTEARSKINSSLEIQNHPVRG